MNNKAFDEPLAFPLSAPCRSASSWRPDHWPFQRHWPDGYRLLRRYWPTALQFSTVWGCSLLAWTLAPTLLDCLHRRSEILEQGHPNALFFPHALFRNVLAASLVVNVLFSLAFLCCRRRPHVPVLLLLPLHVLMLASARSLEVSHQYRVERASRDDVERQWRHFSRLDIAEGFSPALYSFDSRSIPSSALESFQKLHGWVAAEYQKRRTDLKTELDDTNEDRLKTIFYMHFLSDLWAFGNKVATDKPGGALSNEDNEWIPPHEVNAQTLVRSKIGCCADIAYLLKFLLDREKIPNRLTEIRGHVFNEVQLEGEWWIADGTANYLVESSWEDLYRDSEGQELPRVRVRVFPDPRLGSQAGASYRPLTAQLRLQMLLRIAARPAALQATVHPELPAYFPQK